MVKMRTRIKCVLLALVMILSAVPTVSFAEAAFSVTVQNQEIEYVAGAEVKVSIEATANTGVASAVLEVRFPNDALEYTNYANGDVLGSLTEPNADAANKNGKVTLTWFGSHNQTNTGLLITLIFKIKEGATFGKKDIIVAPKDNKPTNVTDEEEKVVPFTATPGSITLYSVLDSVTLTDNVTPPVKLQSDASTVTGDGVTADVSWSPALVDGKFAPNTTYTATVNVKASEGYRFADSPAFTGLNGFGGFTRQEDGSYSASKTFAATAAKELSSIAIDTAPNTTTYEVDEEFSPVGMVVTATYDDGTSETVTNYTWSPNGALAATNTDITVSYEGKTATQKITVTKFDVTLTYENGTATYDGTTDYASTAAKRIQGFQEGLMGSLSVFFKLNDSVVEKLIDAGTYKVYASTQEGTKYNALGETELGTFTINKAAIKPSVSLEDWTYGETAKDPSVSGNTGNGTVTYSYKAKDAEDSTYSPTVPSNAGSYTVKATVAESANYQGGEATADFAITKATVTAPTIAAKTYNGKKQTADVAANDLYTVTSNAGGTTVGAYNVVLTLTDPANYRWTDSEEAAKTLSFQITKATAPAVTAPTLETVTYDPTKTLAGVHLPAGWSWTNGDIVPTVNNNGYDAALTVDDANYDYTGVDRYDAQSHTVTRTVSLTVTKADPTFTPPTGLSLTYDGNDQTLIQPGSTQCGELVYSLNTESYSVILPGGRDAQSYTVYYFLIGGDNYKNVRGSVTATITQAENSISGLTMEGWTYGENAKAPSATATFGTVAYTYGSSQSGTFSEEVPTEAGTWYVKATVAETPNYKGAEAVKPFTIAQREVTLSWGESSFTYDGQSHAPTATAGNLKSGDTVTVTVNGQKIDAGDNYTATASISNSNYKLPKAATCTFSIVKADIAQAQLSGSMTVRSKTEKAVSFTLPTLPEGASYGTPTVSANGDGLIGTAAPTVSGTTLSFSVTSQDAEKTATITVPVSGGNNYNNANYTLTVNSQDKDDAGVTVAAGSGTVTYGDSLTVTGSAKPQAGSGTWTWISSNESVITVSGNGASPTVTVKGAGTATITGTFENDDYLGTNTATVTVTQREVTLTWGTATFNYDGKSHVPDVTLGNVKTGDTVNVTVTGEQTKAGTNYTATAESLDNGNYKLPAANTHSFTINRVASAVTTAPTAQNLTYTGTAQPLVSEGAATGGDMQYSLDGTNYSTTIPTGTAAGSYTVYYKVVGDENHNDTARASVKVTIAKADAGYNAPTAQNLIYNGQAQPLVTAGSTVDGTMQYRLGYGTWGTTVPTATKAGTYTVYYRVTGDNNHNDVAAASVSVTIGRADITPAVSMVGWTYGGKASSPSVSGNSGSGSVTYAYKAKGADDSSYTATKPTNAGDYTVKATVAQTANYNSATATANFTIDKTDASVTAAPTAKTLTYSGTAQALVKSGSASGGKIMYQLNDGEWSTAIPTATNAGTYTVHYRVDGDSNHNSVASQSVTVTIAPKNVTITAKNATKVYGESDPTLTVTVTGVVSGDTIVATASRADGNNVGSYTISAAVDTNSSQYTAGNYNIKLVNATFTITPKTVTVKADDAEKTYGQDDPTLSATVTGLVGDDVITYDVTRQQGENAGRYTITASGAANQGNYTVTYVAGKFTVKPLTGEEVVAGEGVSQMDDSQTQEFREALAQVEQFTGIQEGDSYAERLEAAVKEALVSDARTSAANTSGLYFVSANSAASWITLAVPNGAANSSRFNYKVMYMAANGTISQVDDAKVTVTANGIVVDLDNDASGVYMVAYTPKPVHVVDDSAPTSGSQSIITDLTDINKVTVDGKTVDPKNYTVSGGVVTLSEAYIRTLSNGKHTVRVENAKYISTAVITVSNSTVKSAGTGDAGLGLYAMLALSSVTGAAWLCLKKRKED